MFFIFLEQSFLFRIVRRGRVIICNRQGAGVREQGTEAKAAELAGLECRLKLP